MLSCNAQSYDLNVKTENVRIDITQSVLANENLKKVDNFELNIGDVFPGVITKMQIENDTVYVLDMLVQKGFFAYDKKGNLLFSYCHRGQGPKDFISLTDFYVDNSFIYLLDSSNKILKLNKKGIYQAKINFKQRCYSFAVEKNGGIWLDNGNSTYRTNAKLVYLKDNELQTITTIPKELKEVTVIPYYSFIQLNNELHNLPAMQNVIYSCEEGKIGIRYQLDFGKYFPDREYLNKIKRMHPVKMMDRLVEDGYVTELNFLEDENLLELSFSIKNEYYIYVYDKKSKKNILLKDKEKNFIRPLALHNGCFYFAKAVEDGFEITGYKCVF